MQSTQLSEQFRITKIHHNLAYLEQINPTGCAGCSQSGCGMGLLGRYFNKPLTYPVDSSKQVGDIIKLNLDSHLFIQYTFLLYMVPVLALLLGIGLAYSLNIDNEFFQFLLGLLFLIISLFFLRFLKPKSSFLRDN